MGHLFLGGKGGAVIMMKDNGIVRNLINRHLRDKLFFGNTLY